MFPWISFNIVFTVQLRLASPGLLDGEKIEE
jgi:hypothetical protein